MSNTKKTGASMEVSQDIDSYQPKMLVETSGDYVYATGLGLLSIALSTIIAPAGILAALVGVKQLSPMWKRLDKWMVHMEEAIDQLKGEGITVEDLAQNEQFITALLQASQTAMRTHKKEKLEALQNAVLNIVLGAQPNDNKQQMFLTLIDELTEDHLRILHYLDDPRAYLRQKGLPEDVETPMENLDRSTQRNHGENNIGRLGRAFPELKDQRAYVDLIIATLYGRGLVIGDWPHVADIDEIVATTSPAKEFLAFIKSPLVSHIV